MELDCINLINEEFKNNILFEKKLDISAKNYDKRILSNNIKYNITFIILIINSKIEHAYKLDETKLSILDIIKTIINIDKNNEDKKYLILITCENCGYINSFQSNNNYNNISCNCCKQSGNVHQLTCGHSYHSSCLDKKCKKKCIVCKNNPSKTLIECVKCNKTFIAMGDKMSIYKRKLINSNMIIKHIKILKIGNQNRCYIYIENEYR